MASRKLAPCKARTHARGRWRDAQLVEMRDGYAVVLIAGRMYRTAEVR